LWDGNYAGGGRRHVLKRATIHGRHSYRGRFIVPKEAGKKEESNPKGARGEGRERGDIQRKSVGGRRISRMEKSSSGGNAEFGGS